MPFWTASSIAPIASISKVHRCAGASSPTKALRHERLVWGVVCQVLRFCGKPFLFLTKWRRRAPTLCRATRTRSTSSPPANGGHYTETDNPSRAPMPRDAELSHHNLVFGGVARTHHHDAAMRISGE